MVIALLLVTKMVKQKTGYRLALEEQHKVLRVSVAKGILGEYNTLRVMSGDLASQPFFQSVNMPSDWRSLCFPAVRWTTSSTQQWSQVIT